MAASSGDDHNSFICCRLCRESSPPSRLAVSSDGGEPPGNLRAVQRFGGMFPETRSTAFNALGGLVPQYSLGPTQEPRTDPGAHRDGLLAFFLKPLQFKVLRTRHPPRSPQVGVCATVSELNAFRNALKTDPVSLQGRPSDTAQRVSKRRENRSGFVAVETPRHSSTGFETP